LNHHWIQLAYQLADSVSGAAFSFFGTCLILAALDFLGKFIPVLKLRVTEEEEISGIDDVEIGEFAVSTPKTRMVSKLYLTNSATTVRLRRALPRSQRPRRHRRQHLADIGSK
jgi:hypothetical protein